MPAWISGSLKPVIVEHPASQTSRRSDKVLLRCRVSASIHTNLTFSWQKDEQKFELMESKNHMSTFVSNDTVPIAGRRSPRDQQIEYVNELHIVDIEDGEEGSYQCLVHSRFGTLESKQARITLTTEPYFARTPVDVIVRAGDTARFECAARGDPRPVISWSKQNEAVFLAATERRMQLMPQDSSIHIVAVRAEDSGTYICRAESTAGVATTTAVLTVIQVPHFVKAMTDQQVVVGEKVVLECKASGSPRPSLTWTKNGLPLRLTKRHFFTSDNEKMVIIGANKSDSGMYACLIANSLGSVKQSLLLKVTDPPFYQSLWLFTQTYAVPIFWTLVFLAITFAVFAVMKWRSSVPADSKVHHKDKMGQTTIIEGESEGETSITMTPDVVFDDSMRDRDRIPYHLDIGR